jgi:hypothetical protein
VRDVAPDALRLDLPVYVGFEKLEDGAALPVFLAGST